MKNTNAVITLDGTVTGTQLDSYADIFAFDAVAGFTYTIDFVSTSERYSMLEETGLVFDETDANVGYAEPYGNKTFVAPFTGRFYVVGGAAGEFDRNIYTIAFSVTESIESIESMINDALNSVKTYVDSKDAAVRLHAETLVDQLMQTSDLSAKLALLNEINAILDGDTASAGFQLWESNVAKLNKVVADLVAETSARSSEIGATSNSLQTIINTTANEINARIDSINSDLSGSISTSVATLNTNVTANFVAMKSKAAIIFAV